MIRVRALAALTSLALLAGCQASLTAPSYRPVKDPSLVSAAKLLPCPVAGKSVAKGLPKLVLHCLDGSTTADLAGLRGPALVNVWSSSCGPCKTESPALEKYREMAGGKVTVIGIDVDPYPDDGLTFAYNQHLHYPSFVDEHTDVQAKLGVVALPTTFFIDAAGHLVGHPQVQAFTNEAQVAAAVKAHLGISVS